MACMTFPAAHLAKLHSTNPLERLRGKFERRTSVVSSLPNENAITRLIGAVLVDRSDEWRVQRARLMTLESLARSIDLARSNDKTSIKLPVTAA